MKRKDDKMPVRKEQSPPDVFEDGHVMVAPAGRPDPDTGAFAVNFYMQGADLCSLNRAQK